MSTTPDLLMRIWCSFPVTIGCIFQLVVFIFWHPGLFKCFHHTHIIFLIKLCKWEVIIIFCISFGVPSCSWVEFPHSFETLLISISFPSLLSVLWHYEKKVWPEVLRCTQIYRHNDFNITFNNKCTCHVMLPVIFCKTWKICWIMKEIWRKQHYKVAYTMHELLLFVYKI